MPWVLTLNEKLENKIKDNELGKSYERKEDSNYAIVFRQSGLIFRWIVNN